MHFLNALATCLAATTLSVNALPQPETVSDGEVTTVSFSGTKAADGHITAALAPSEQSDAALQKRVAPVVIVIGIAAVKGTAIVTKIAIEIASDTIKNLGEWNKARETFTKKTTAEMWARNPDRSKYPAAICYNKSYRVKDPNGITGKVSAKFELGLLNTDYDCMYMTGNNAFWTDSDNGFINLSYSYDSSRCTFDGSSGDLTCR